MGKDSTQVTLGSGDLYLNNVDVGHLQGDVVLTLESEFVDFRPSNMNASVKRFVTGEVFRLTARLAEIKTANMRLALGISTAVGASQSFPDYDPSSYSAAADDSFDVIHVGDDKTVSEVSLRFEHQLAQDTDKKIIVVMYQAVSNRVLNIPFAERDVIIEDIEWTSLADADRTAGDRLGFIAVQVQKA